VSTRQNLRGGPLACANAHDVFLRDNFATNKEAGLDRPPRMGASASSIDDAEQFVPDPEPRRWSGLRLLCLHGHGSNNDITQMQVHHMLLRERHGVSCDLFRAETETWGPQNSNFELVSEGPFYTWFDHTSQWLSSKLGFGAQSSSLDAALRRVMALVEARGPYDGIYGFSQGGFMAAALCNRSVWQSMFGLEKCPFRFAILACSALDSVLASCEVPIGADGGRAKLKLPVEPGIPSLHLIGESDWHRSASHGMAKHFEDSRTYVHASGHEIPMRLQLDEKLGQLLSEFFGRFSAAGARDWDRAHDLTAHPLSAAMAGTSASSAAGGVTAGGRADADDDARRYDLW